MTVAVADVSTDNGSVCIRLSGEIDRANVSAVEEQIRAAVSGQRTAVSVDLVNVIYIDSTGKQLLFDLALLLQRSHIVLEIIVPFDSPIRRLIELAGLQSIATLVLVHRPDSSQVGDRCPGRKRDFHLMTVAMGVHPYDSIDAFCQHGHWPGVLPGGGSTSAPAWMGSPSGTSVTGHAPRRTGF